MFGRGRRGRFRALGVIAITFSIVAITYAGVGAVGTERVAAATTRPLQMTTWRRLAGVGHAVTASTDDGAVPQHRVLEHQGTTEIHTSSIPESDISNNWAGETETGTTFTSVSATWTVPSVQPSASAEESSTWVGIDGVSNHDLIQAGTEQDSGPGETTDYFAWFEILPNAAQELGPVSPGDIVTVDINEVSAGTWSIDIADNNNGGHASGNVAYDGPASSAEWIEEAPSNQEGQIAPLADFGSVQFDNIVAGGTSISAATMSPAYMANDRGTIIAYPSDPSGGSFDVTYGSPSSSPTSSSTTSTTLAGSTSTSLGQSSSTTSSTTLPGSTLTTAGTHAAALSRLSGSSRIATAVAISNQSFPTPGGAQAAVLSADDDFPDALAGTPLAVAKGGPMLLTSGTSLDPSVAAELTRVLPAGATVYLLGGTGALSDQVASQVAALGFTVVRYGGATRFDTAVIIASEGLGNPSTVLEANGLDFPDALTAGAAASAVKGAVLLTDGDTQALATANYLSQRPADTRYALGGPAASADPAAKPIVGSDRYQTSALVAESFFPSPTTVGIATGLAFPDALSGGAQVGRLGGPLLLTDPGNLSASTASYLTTNASHLSGAYLYGGPLALSDTVASAVASALGVATPASVG